MEKAKLKQRVAGAAVLLALAAIIVPVLVDRYHDSDGWGAGSNIPPKPANGFVTRVLPLEKWDEQARSELATAETATKPPETEKSGKPVAPVQSNADQAATPVQPLSKQAAPSAAVTPPDATKAETGTPARGWVVQLGSFSNQKNAEELRDRLLNKGYHAYIEATGGQGHVTYRVRIGPESQRAAAETIREQVERETHAHAVVLAPP